MRNRPASRLFLHCTIVAGGVILSAPPADAGERLAGPVGADVVRIIDGDTLTVEAQTWLGQRITVDARIRGIDTPELRGDCAREKAMAAAARAALAGLAEGRAVRLADIEHDKYAGRVLADVATADGTDLGALMIAAGHARRYDGGARGGWCDLAGIGGANPPRRAAP